MSYQTLCDCCGRVTDRCVINNRVQGSYVHLNTKVNYEIMLGTGNTMNGGNLCMDCLEDIISAVLGIERAPQKDSDNG